MKILFLTDNFPPESNAPASRTYAHCKEWVRQGMEVTVITGVPNFPKGKVFAGYKNRWRQEEEMEGMRVIRVWTYIAANEGFFKRTLDFISFMISSFWVGLFIKTDVIVATSPQFFTAVSGRWLSFWKREKWVMEVRDIWPESIKAVGAMKGNLIIQYFEFLERRMYQSATKIVTVTDAFKSQLISKHNIIPQKIGVFKNGVDSSLFQPKGKDLQILEELRLQGKFIIGYIGTHGMAHKLDFILESAKEILDNEIHFLFLGTGAEKEYLLKKKEDLKLQNVTMLDAVSKSEVSRYVSILDVGLVNLKKSDTFKSVIPSKIFELAAMHKPILLGAEGESRTLLEDYNLGLAFEPENRNHFLEKISQLKAKETALAPKYDELLHDFNREKLAVELLHFIR